ncbi:MAG: cobyrinate a,c-diamide synthase [Peptococcaceae bacterium]|jgi:cobyrinic acid a,c-diamide synthase|nr:cobyrinate a,c-diamide synthase [Peptococcaceae bacterium]
MPNFSRIVIGATHSGAGKTTVAAALMAALTAAGLTVQPFKVGPDYIDPGYHTAATGRVCRNLDPWLMGEDGVRECFRRAAHDADISVIEGVMGLFDGQADTGTGSTAQVARLLSAPVLLVVDARSLARSAAALVRGYRDFEPGLDLGGVILNRTGSERHRALLLRAVQGEAGLPVIGALGREDEVSLPERHLGLLPAVERGGLDGFVERLAGLGRQLDLQAVVRLAASAPGPPMPSRAVFPAEPMPPAVRLGVARDQAFNFYYQDSLDLLRALGAELVEVSPVSGTLDPGLDGIYLGGGFPEVFAGEIAANGEFMRVLRTLYDGGLPVYAECGGLMYLGRSLRGPDGAVHPMAGLLAGETVMERRRAALGYVTATVLTGNLLAPAGTILTGHEFHYSTYRGERPGCPAYRVSGAAAPDGRLEGVAGPHLLASYVHLHFVSCPDSARAFLNAANRYRLAREGGLAP